MPVNEHKKSETVPLLNFRESTGIALAENRLQSWRKSCRNRLYFAKNIFLPISFLEENNFSQFYFAKRVFYFAWPGRGLNFGRPSFATPSVDRDVKPMVYSTTCR